LAEAGADALTLDSLCRRVRVTKGSFRWHFDTMAGFLDALAAHWVQTEEDRLSRLRAEPDPRLRLQGHLQHLLCRPDPTRPRQPSGPGPTPNPPSGARCAESTRPSRTPTRPTSARSPTTPTPTCSPKQCSPSPSGCTSAPPDVGPDLATRIVHLWANRFLRVPAELDITDGMPVLTVARHTPA
jgi:AcrR family transcriptional regulator